MTAGEVVALVTVIGVPVASALIAIGVYLGKRNEAHQGASRETIQPQAPTTSHPSLQDLSLAAISARAEGNERSMRELEREVRASLGAIEVSIERLATLIDERTNRGGRSRSHGNDREST